jgi:hypothetical protein
MTKRIVKIYTPYPSVKTNDIIVKINLSFFQDNQFLKKLIASTKTNKKIHSKQNGRHHQISGSCKDF